MKQGTRIPTKSTAISASEKSMIIDRSAESLCAKQSSKGLSSVLNKKMKSSKSLEIPKASKSSSASSRSVKSCLKESLPKYKVEEMSSAQMHESLIRVQESPAQPFAFLSNILDERTFDDHVPIGRTNTTEIDLQLAALTRRVNLNKSLLERTNERVKEINFLVERNAMIASRELNHGDKIDSLDSGKVLTAEIPHGQLLSDEDAFQRMKGSGDGEVDIESRLNAACPGIMELQRTINQTKDMLGYVKKICNDEMRMSELPEELATYAAANFETA